MFEAPFAIGGKLRDAWLSLPSGAWRTFAHLSLDMTADRAHPHWGARPLSRSTLLKLWPGSPPTVAAQTDRLRSLRGAVESELAARAAARLPDVVSLTPHLHLPKLEKYGGCHACGGYLAREQPTCTDAWQRINTALTSIDDQHVLVETPVLLAELLSEGLTLETLHRLLLRSLLSRLTRGALAAPWRAEDLFLSSPPNVQANLGFTLFRHISHDKPSSLALSTEMEAIHDVFVASTTGKDLVLQIRNLMGDESEALIADEKLGLAAETWLAYLRMAFPRHNVRLGGTFEVRGNTLRGYRPREHRQFWQSKDTSAAMLRLLRARSKISADDRERLDASMTWAGLSMSLWAESPVRALALIWMALEVLFGDLRRVLDLGVLPYLKRLPIELGFEVARHVARRAQFDRPPWLLAVAGTTDGAIKRHLDVLARILQSEPEETLLRLRVNELLSIWPKGHRVAIAQRLRRDLLFVYAARNGMAHTGRVQISPTVSHYLMNVAIEVLKASISELIAANESGTDITSIDPVLRACEDWI